MTATSPRVLTIGLLLALAVVACGGVTTAQADRHHRTSLTCRSGTTVVLQGRLRVFAVAVRYRNESTEGELFTGFNVYGCVPGGRPQFVGQTGEDLDCEDWIHGLVFDGSTQLGATLASSCEADENDDVRSVDLRTGRRYENDSLGIAVGQMANGSTLQVADNGFGALELAPRRGRRLALAPGSDHPSEVAVTGATAYWTQKARGRGRASELVRSIRQPANARQPENIRVGVLFGPGPARTIVRHSACERHPGTTIARSPSVRVYVVGSAHVACSRTQPQPVALSARTTAGAVRIVDNRWLATIAGSGPRRTITVYDMNRGKAVTRVRAPIASWTVSGHGALAWIVRGGPLEIKTPAGHRPRTLAHRADAPTALASSSRTVYWTAGARPHHFATH
jgi:hypothetical protein